MSSDRPSPLALELKEVLDLRRRGLRLRLGVAIAISLSFMPVIDWRLSASWGVAYCLLQLAEVRWASRAPPLGVLALLAASSLIFGAFALTGPSQNGGWGAAAGMGLICGAYLNTAMGTLKSKAAFCASFAPFTLILALLPIVGSVEGANLRQIILLELAGGYVTVMGYLIWKTGSEAFKAEERARAEAQAANNAKSAFVAMVSHELRTPINAIMAGAEAAASRGTERREDLDLITGSARMMRTLLNDLLDLSKIEAGRMSIEETPFDLHRLVDDCARFWEPEARKRSLGLCVEGAENLPRAVIGDPTRIQQVLNNLLSNALKFTSSGDVTLRTASEACEGGWRLTLTVADTGLGMTPEQTARLFTPYEQADPSISRTHGGTGLGLSISRKLARLMGGDLTVCSEVGKGSEFELTIALQSAIPDAGRTEPSAEPRVGLSILAADDHPINRKALELILGPVTTRLVLVSDGIEAVEQVTAGAFDLVLLDLNMGEMGGLEAARRIRAQLGPNLPILALTGSVSDADRRACLDAGMNNLIAKPIEPGELLAAIGEALEAAEARDQMAAA